MNLAMSLPEHVGVQEGFILLGLKLRMTPEYTGGQHIRILEFDVEVNQVGKFCLTEDTPFIQTFPLPTILEQPPHLPLLNPCHMESLDACGFLLVGSHQRKVTRRHPINGFIIVLPLEV